MPRERTFLSVTQPELIYAYARNLTSDFLLICSKCP